MASSDSETSQLKLKLFIDKKEQRVLFAEAGKDMVDFLFYLFSLPVATVTKFLKKKGAVGCLTDLYESLDNLCQTYMQPDHQNNSSLLNPKSTLYANGLPLLLTDSHVPMLTTVYQCPNYYHVSDIQNKLCPCGHSMATSRSFISSNPAAKTGTTLGDGGFVIGKVPYMVMDNLEVKPLSTACFTTLLNEFNVKDFGSLKEKNVVLGIDEGIMLLKASMECKTVLTSVFLGNNGD